MVKVEVRHQQQVNGWGIYVVTEGQGRQACQCWVDTKIQLNEMRNKYVYD